MRVYFDYQALTMQRFGGISRYYYEVITRLANLGLEEVDICCFLSQNEYFRGYSGVNTVGAYHWRIGEFIKEINKTVALSKIKNGRYDIIHPTYYDPYLFGKTKSRIVVTVHDMIHEMFPEYYADDRTIEFKKESIFKSDYIIAISKNTKKDILKFYPEIKSEKIGVIYHGSTLLNPGGKKSEIELPDKYVLFVGYRYAYKNFKRFFESMIPFMENSGLNIVCAGGGAFTSEEKSYIGKYRNRVYQFTMDDADLQHAYRKAELFVFPSLYEGFGLPLLEAFQCGCPVACSNTSSFPEVGGETAEYFDPRDTGSMTEVISRILESRNDSSFTEKRTKKMKEQVAFFSWDKAVQKLQECYEKVCNE